MKVRSTDTSIIRNSEAAYNPKWSWADPMEDEPGPGTFNTKSTFDGNKGYSMPKAVKRVTKLNPKTSPSPGVGTYSPLATVTKRKATACKIGTGP